METETPVVEKQTSSMMEEPSYDSETQLATITFKNGSATYNYPMAPEEFAAFHAAKSWGRHFHAHPQLFANGVRIGSPEQKPS